MIWCVEDDTSIRSMEVYALQSTGFEARGFEDGTSFWEALKADLPDLVILDIMLPGVDGVELLRRIRETERTRELPVIMATAKDTEFDKIESLDLGADDYVAKPFGVMELVSRVKAVLRRYKRSENNQQLKMGGLIIHLDEHTVTVDDVRVQVTFKEYELLKLFMSQPGVAFTRDQLFDHVWGGEHYAESRTVDVHIRTLRQKLGPYGNMIETVRNVGYRLEGMV